MRIVFVSVAVLLTSCAQPAPTAPKQSEPAATAPALALPKGLTLAGPLPGVHVKSPIKVTGTATGDWYFEAIFTANLEDANGRILAEAPAQAQSDWMTPEPVPFLAEIAYKSPTEQPAVIVLIEDDTGEDVGPLRELRIPVTLAPSP